MGCLLDEAQQQAIVQALTSLEASYRGAHRDPGYRWVDAVDNDATRALDSYWRNA